MIVPSIDLQAGRAVQLVGGERQALDAGDPLPIAERFAVAGELAVIDLDAARGRGSNAALVETLAGRFPCRVGGGLRDYETAVRRLDAGAARVILGTAAEPALLRRLPRERLQAALDSRHGDVVVEGWTRGTGRGVLERIAELKPHVGGFLVTFVEREGRLEGIDLDRVREVVAAADPVRVTVAGGVTTAEELAEIDRLGADAQVGMALYTGRLELADALAAPLRSDRPDGLWATVVVDESGRALGLAWSDRESLREAVRTRRGAYHSRTRGLWVKGETSGDRQELLRVELDCDRDALRFVVRQHGRGFCHRGTRSCWGDDAGLPALLRTLRERARAAPPGSYTSRLLGDPSLLRAKLLEEAGELADAAPETAPAEAADLFYFALVALVRAGGDLADVERELDRRARRISRRPGDAKPETR
ncbi:MAG: phosphoribosyl-ATP diphosphatase [Deltaproteobacteria bacterium]|nr:phosphoribosyl-ATP diphosphatase [Deltaproteobacteria bacterium]